MLTNVFPSDSPTTTWASVSSTKRFATLLLPKTCWPSRYRQSSAAIGSLVTFKTCLVYASHSGELSVEDMGNNDALRPRPLRRSHTTSRMFEVFFAALKSALVANCSTG